MPVNKETRLAGLGPATSGSVDRCSENISQEKTKTCENTKEQLTLQLTPKIPKQGEIDTASTVCLTAKLPDDLAEIVSAWPNLPEHIKDAVKALIQTEKR